ncbi:MAG: ATP-binding cassette domain-containing protein [Phycisphaerales bacterium]|nr:ATP-binding cassette domain-containing protein [Phycisphaerales bacterium]
MASVLLTNVSKVYAGGLRAVDSLSMAIADGEFVVIVGPSGCGKTTTLRMIAGLEKVSGGTIAISSRVVNAVAPRDRNIAMVFQNYALYPHLSVRDNLSFGLERRRRFPSRLRALWDSPYRIQRRKESVAIESRVLAAATTLGIDGLLNRPPRELSGGQRQRVAVGRALVRDPAVFLFDEPLSNLDALLRGEMRTELRILHRRLKATMIYVTHDQEEAMSLADRIVVMRDGIVQQIGSPGEVYDRPANRFVAGFMGSPPMIMLPATLARGDDAKLTLAWGVTELTLPRGRWTLSALASLTGTVVTLGIRPDRIAPSGTAAGSTICGRVAAIERYGALCDVVLEAEGARVIARWPSERAANINEGDPISLSIDAAAAHLFDSDGLAVERA